MEKAERYIKLAFRWTDPVWVREDEARELVDALLDCFSLSLRDSSTKENHDD